MILWPAIDLKDGQCVRLKGGDMGQATVFNDSPAAQAKSFRDAGFKHLHVVDLNGAFAGKPVNADAVRAIRAATDAEMQLGGGIRDMAGIEAWLAAGVSRVILGTAAARNPQLVIDACEAFPGRVAVGIDARDGRVAVQGWAEVSDLDVIELARRFEGAGVAALIFTDIARDGLLTGVNVTATAALARAVTIPVIASGGAASLDDIVQLKAEGCIAGVIVGRALYDGRIDPRAALDLLAA